MKAKTDRSNLKQEWDCNIASKYPNAAFSKDQYRRKVKQLSMNLAARN